MNQKKDGWSLVPGDVWQTEIPIGMGLVASPNASIYRDDYPMRGFHTTIQVAFDPKPKRYIAKSFKIVAGDGFEVTSLIIRDVPINRAIQEVGLNLIRTTDLAPLTVAVIEDKITAATGSRSELEKVAAFIYLYSHTLNFPPMKTVSDLLNVSLSTAKRIIAKARAKGLLEGI